MKKTKWYCLFLYFFTILDIIWPKFCPKTTPDWIFFLVCNEVCWEIQLIIKTLIEIQYFWKILAKTSKNYYFLFQLAQKWGPHGPYPKQKTFFFFFFFWERTKADPKLSKPFYFNKISYVWLSYECFSILCDAFSLKSVIFSLNSCDIWWDRNPWKIHDRGISWIFTSRSTFIWDLKWTQNVVPFTWQFT